MLEILSFGMKKMQEVKDASDERYHSGTDTKLLRIVKTFSINVSFIAVVSEQIYYEISYISKSCEPKFFISDF